jgi:hypothetical protein
MESGMNDGPNTSSSGNLVPGAFIKDGTPSSRTGSCTEEQEIVFFKENENSKSPSTESCIMGNLEDLPKDKRAHSRFLSNRETIKRLVETEDDDYAKYPADCYSFISLNGPLTPYFWFGIMVFVFQISFLILGYLSVFSKRWRTGKVDDNPDDEGFLSNVFPTEAAPTVRIIQFISLLSSVIFVDTSILDIITAIHTFPAFRMSTRADNVWLMALSCILRFLQGACSVGASLILVFSTDDVIEIVLNFTALNFVSTLDDIAFEFASAGKYG